MLRFEDASFRYFGEKFNVLQNINLNINKGTKIAILAKQNCGKSSFMKAILKSNQLYLSHGRMFIENKEIHQLNKNENRLFLRKVFFFGNKSNMIFHESIYQNIKHEILLNEPFWRQLLGLLSETQKALIYAALEFVELTEFAFEKVSTLTPTNQRKVEIAKLFVSEATVVLADDPTTDIDALYSKQIINWIKEIVTKRKATLIWTSHDQSFLKEHFKKIYLINEGKILPWITKGESL